MRKYSLPEIDQMRGALHRLYPMGISYYPAKRSAEVEDRLRTHMQNGTSPAELDQYAADFAHRDPARIYAMEQAEAEYAARKAAKAK